MQPGLEVIAPVAIGTIAAGFAAFRVLGRQRIIRIYKEGRALRLVGEYDLADQKLSVASVSFPSAQILRFWMMLERRQVGEAQALLKQFPPTLSALECQTWNALRYGSLRKAEEQVAKMLHLKDSGGEVTELMQVSTLYTHACLLVEEESLNYAQEKFTQALKLARETYGMGSVYAVPPAVALSYLHFLSGEFDSSAKLLGQALRSYTRTLGKTHVRTSRIRAMVAFVEMAVGMKNTARAELEFALKALREAGLNGTPDAKAVSGALKTLS